jgi:hypothetical protein
MGTKTTQRSTRKGSSATAKPPAASRRKVDLPAVTAPATNGTGEPTIVAVDPGYARLYEIDPKLAEVYRVLNRKKRDAEERTLTTYYAIGKTLNRDVEGKFKAGQIRQLEHELGIHPSMLRFARVLAKEYDEQKIRGILAARTADGSPLTLNHVRAIVSVAADQREKLFQKTLANNMSVEQLTATIQKSLGRRSNGGAPVRVPSTFTGRIERGLKSIRVLRKYEEEIWGAGALMSLFQDRDSLEPTEIDAIRSLRDEISASADMMRGDVEQLDSFLGRHEIEIDMPAAVETPALEAPAAPVSDATPVRRHSRNTGPAR